MSSQSTSQAGSAPPQVGLILAGGRSTRMQQDKAQLKIGAQTLLAFMQAKLDAAGLTEIWVSGPQPGAIADLYPDLGPLGGIASAVARAADHTQMLIVAVDQPRLSVGLLRTLLDAPDSAAVRFEREPLPMRLTVNPDLQALLHASLNATHSAARSLFALQQALQIACLSVGAHCSGQLESVNTPEQWRDFLAELGGRDRLATP